MNRGRSSSRSRADRPRSAAGFTLIELMVALLLSLILAVAVLKVQAKLASQSVRLADTGMRDTQTRAAMDLITRDVTSAGFLLGDTQYYCDALFTYDSAGPGYFVHHPVDAVAAVSGTQMAFAPSLTLNYPAGAAAAVASDVLVTTGSTGATQFNDATNPVQKGNATPGVNPLLTGIAPVSSTLGFTALDTAIVQVPIKTMAACLRVPITTVVAGASIASTSGPTMPSNFYTGFVSQVAAAGFPDVLSNAGLFNARFVDIGTSATSTEVVNVYYVDGSGSFPVLMRAQYSLVDDSVVTAPQPIAAGVVSIRVSFGVDPANTGAVTAYESSALVTTNGHWSFVRSVRVALVTRTIDNDPTADNTLSANAYTGPTSIAIGPASSPWFANLSVPASTQRYSVSTTEIAYRNWLWKN